MNKKLYLFLDIETSGIPPRKTIDEFFPPSQTEKYNSSRVVQMAYGLYKPFNKRVKRADYIISPDDFSISTESAKIHSITQNRAEEEGCDMEDILTHFNNYYLKRAKVLVVYNKDFTLNVFKSELHRYNRNDILESMDKLTIYDVQNIGKLKLKIKIVRDSDGKVVGYRRPSLDVLYKSLFNKTMKNKFNAKFDVVHSAQCFFYMMKLGIEERKNKILTK